MTKLPKPPRFVVTPPDAGRMNELGKTFLTAFKERLDRAQNIFDAPARPLSRAYARRKARLKPPAIRNLRMSGITRDTIHVMASAEGRAVIGTRDWRANMILTRQNRLDPQWGMSPRDRAAVERRLAEMKSVRTEG